MKTDYSRWMDSVMKERKDDRKRERIQTILAIRSLGLPYDLTKEMILSYKYDILEAKWRRYHRVVMCQVRSGRVSSSTRRLGSSKSRTWKPSRTS